MLKFAFAAVGFCAAVAAANPTYAPCKSSVSVDERWALTPIVANDNGFTYVHSVLALNKVGLTNGEIKAVWYTIDQANGCKWSAVTWDGATPEDAIKHVKLALGMNDANDADWGVPINMTAATPAQQVIDYAKGFDAADPVGQLINDINNPWRDEDVAFLASIGYKAADVSFERKDQSDDPNFANTFLSTASAIALQVTAAGQPVVPGPGPVAPGWPAWPAIPTLLPNGTPATPVTLPCAVPCVTMSMTIKGPWSSWTAAPTWELYANHPMSGLSGECVYHKYICQYRAVWTASTTAPSCVLTYTFDGFESQCWMHEMSCHAKTDNAGARACPNPPDPQNQECDSTATPNPGPPTNPSSPLVPHP